MDSDHESSLYVILLLFADTIYPILVARMYLEKSMKALLDYSHFSINAFDY